MSIYDEILHDIEMLYGKTSKREQQRETDLQRDIASKFSENKVGELK